MTRLSNVTYVQGLAVDIHILETCTYKGINIDLEGIANKRFCRPTNVI